MHLYLYGGHDGSWHKGLESYEARGKMSEKLVFKALYDYCSDFCPGSIDVISDDISVERSEKGKPYFKGLLKSFAADLPQVCFSVSHSGGWWGCLMGCEPVGFDLEVCRKGVEYEKIARRFFTPEEQELILKDGENAFFEIWVRKEAYIKYLGTGLAEGLSSFSVVDDGKLSAQVILKDDRTNRQPCFLRSCEMGEEVKAAYCSADGTQIKKVISMNEF
jgi:Phosphopantetheinyl transferase